MQSETVEFDRMIERMNRLVDPCSLELIQISECMSANASAGKERQIQQCAETRRAMQACHARR